ncbi:18607_t:CDS:10 [Acaulospora morrowiae]|uniref:18607_t:CDS:1 n=1 Tax=Acaulospora morrowiae TaxID=94023 RepID=A0A9N9FBV0_9GLOM|nr:18607_t:CDS:10 [Acaulospora morrowiae]
MKDSPATPLPHKSHAHAQVELKISCTDLPNLDYISKTDPQVILLSKDQRTQKWSNTPHATEVIKNNLDPKFVKGIVVDYFFEELQKYRFIVVNVNDKQNQDWRDQEFIGQFDCDLGSILGSPGGKIKGRLISPKHRGKKRGFIIITAEEVSSSRREAKLQFRAHNVGKGGLFETKTNLFFTISRINEDKTFSPVYESIDVTSTSPLWPAFTIRESTLCNGDPNRTIMFQVHQRKKNDTSSIQGQYSLTLREIMTGNRRFTLQSPSGDTKKNAYIEILQAQIEEPPTFLDYIIGGMRVNLAVAIDFTTSNGDPRSLKSLHYACGTKDNDYQKAIRNVGSILESYDHNRKFPVSYKLALTTLRFRRQFSIIGINRRYTGLVPEVEGVGGILAAYLKTIKSVELYGPTCFSPVIEQTINEIEEKLKTGDINGVITDMEDTIRAIIKASALPLSIVIVGVGNADFTAMNILDSDDHPLMQASNNKKGQPLKSQRDIVQFIALRDFQSKTTQHHLPRAVLEEIPGQFMSYMKKNNIKPSPPAYVKAEELLVSSKFDVKGLDESPPYYSD